MILDDGGSAVGVGLEADLNVVAVTIGGDASVFVVGDPVAAGVVPAPADDDGLGGVHRVGGGEGFDEVLFVEQEDAVAAFGVGGIQTTQALHAAVQTVVGELEVGPGGVEVPFAASGGDVFYRP